MVGDDRVARLLRLRSAGLQPVGDDARGGGGRAGNARAHAVRSLLSRPDGTVMTTDCPSGARPRRTTACVVAARCNARDIVGGRAEPVPERIHRREPTTPTAEEPKPETDDYRRAELMGIARRDLGRPFDDPIEPMGVIVAMPEPRPAVEWSFWGRLGVGLVTSLPMRARAV